MTELSGNLGTSISQSQWPEPKKIPHSGRYVDLVPLTLDHLDDLWVAAATAPESFGYLKYGPFADKGALRTVLQDLSTRADQPFWAVIPKNGKPSGWASICDICPADGNIEIGSIWFAPALQGNRAGREALFILMCVTMDDLGYERLTWRCQAQNAKSFRAAENLGFTHEGTWRNAMVVKGWQRDVAWFSILKSEWPDRRAALERWLSPDNFDENGQQMEALVSMRQKDL